MPPLVTAGLILQIVGKETTPDGTQAVFTSQPEGLGFPILLNRDTLPQVLAAVDSGEWSIQKLAVRLQAIAAELPDHFRSQLANINTPADLEDLKQREAQGSSRAR